MSKIVSEIENPLSISVLKATIFVTCSLLIGELNQSFHITKKILSTLYSGKELFMHELSYFSVFYGIVISLFTFLVGIASTIFWIINKKESISLEIANNNLRAIFIFSGILISLVLIIKPEVHNILDQFIPYPQKPVFR
jgi:hypothetical protein